MGTRIRATRGLAIIVAATLLWLIGSAALPVSAGLPTPFNPITNVSINSGGDAGTVMARESFTVSFDYYINVPSSCPDCATQIEVGWSQDAGPVACAYDGHPGLAGVVGSWSGNLTAPNTPGTYYIAYDQSLRDECDASAAWWSTPILIATVTVNPNPACFSIASADWGLASTWSCGHVPGGAEDAIVQGHVVTLANADAAVKDLIIADTGSVDINGHTLVISGDLIDDSTALKAIEDRLIATAPGKVSFEGPVEQWIRSESGKTEETRFGVKVEAKQRVALEKGVCFEEQLKLANNGSYLGSIDVAGQVLALKKDLVDDSTALKAIEDRLIATAPGKVSFEGPAEQWIRSESGKTEETRFGAKVEAKQRVTLQKDVRLEEQLKLANNGSYLGSIDVAGQVLALKRDLVDDSTALKAIEDRLIATSPGKVSFEGPAEQWIRSEGGKTEETRFGVKVEAKQRVKLQKDVRLEEQLKLANNGSYQGSIDVGGRILALKKDLVDDSTADKVLEDTSNLAGKVSFEGPVEQLVKSEGGKTEETRFGVRVEARQRVTLQKNARMKEEVTLKDNGGCQGYLDVAGQILALEKDLVDDSTAGKAIEDRDTKKAGKVSFEGTAEQRVKSEGGKTEETRFGAKVETKQRVALEKGVCFEEQLKLANNGSSLGSIDVAGQVLALKRDLVDDSTALKAIEDRLIATSPGKVSFEGPAEQWIRSEGGKTEETRFGVKVEAKQRVTLQKNARMQEEVTLIDQDPYYKGSFDIAGQILALERDLVDDSTAEKAIEDRLAVNDTGEVVFDGAADQFLRSHSTTAQTRVEAAARIRKASGKMVIATETSLTKARFGAIELTRSQEVELRARAEIFLDQTLQLAVFEMTTEDLSKVFAEINAASDAFLIELRLAKDNIISAARGSLQVVVMSGNPVQGTIGDNVTIAVPVNTAALIDDSVGNGFTISNTSTDPDAGSITVSVGGETTQLAPGDLFDNLLVVGPALPVERGATANVTVSYRDGSPIPESVACSIAWGDGQMSEGTLMDGIVSASHTYCAMPGVYQVVATLTDALGNTASGFLYVTVVDNIPPVANPGGPYLGAINTAIPFDGGASSDEDGDFLTYAWTFGDGGAGTGVAPSHSYAAPGIYDVCLTVNDGAVDSGPACTMAVAYDPSGGFVTGGGWIDSPAGAYTANASLTGKATFGFVAKYQKGAKVPTGDTEFQFQAGDFTFHSTAYEWLVVSKLGNTAQFKGSGMVNGALAPNGNAYKFMLWAGDGASDTFRIRIWWEGADGVENVVYDNGFDQAIGGGSIVVHKAK